ncbi:MAG: arylsulfotransferase family protein [Clostridia bacterium]
MKKIISKNKIWLIVVLWLITSACFVFGGGLLGLEYFQDEFVTFRSKVVSIVNTSDSVSDVVSEVNDAVSESFDEVSLTVNGYDLDISLGTDTHTWFDVEQMSTLIPNTISLDDTPSGYDVYIDGTLMLEGEEISIELEELSQAIGIQILLVNQNTSEKTYYNIRTLHTAYDAIASGEGEGDGYYYFTQSGNIYKMDMSGNIVYYKDCAGSAGRNFQQVTTEDGTIYYTYVETAQNNTDEKLESVQYTQVQGVVMDENYEVVDIVEFLNTSEGMDENHSLESHEFYMIDLGHYFVSAYVGMEVDNIPTDVEEDGSAYVAASVIQEIKDGELVFQWVSTDYEELYAYSVSKTDYSSDSCQDYMHFNSVNIAPDGNIICSFRRIDAVIKIDRETSEIIWILGGEGDMFGLTDEQKFSFQHLAYYSDENTITLFDNGNENEQTRAVEITIDEETMTVTDYTAYEIEGAYSAAQGSAIRLDDDEAIFLMGWGTRTDDGIIFSEINFDTGEVYFQLMDLDMDSSECTYRVYKFDS